MSKENESSAPFALPDDLKGLSADEIASLTEAARAEFGGIYEAEGGPQADSLARARELADAIGKLNAESTRRAEESAATQAEFDKLMSSIKPAEAAATEPNDGDGGTATTTEPAATPASTAPAAATPVPLTASSTTAVPRELAVHGARVNPSMANARNAAPVAAIPSAPYNMQASTGLPSGALTAGALVPNLATLGELTEFVARGLPVVASGWTPGKPYGGRNVSRVRHEFSDVFSPSSTPDVIEAYRDRVRKLGQRPADMATLVAAGGFCSPSQIRYDFYNVSCAGGKIDLPTFGVERGGLRAPVSPSLADASGWSPVGATGAATTATVPWSWTETNDAIAATGTLVKPCIRIPCSSMTETRLGGFGVCVTAGNLADNAWPESTANFLRLIDAAFQHVLNYNQILQVRNLTTDMGTIACTGVGAASPVLDAVELAAVDYRKKLFMCWDDVVEVIFPEYVVPILRADVARRTGVDMLGVTDQMILDWFNVRHVRVQLVDDYQVRGSGQPGTSAGITAWGSTIEFMIFAPGTYGLGNGMTLDLGVVRDSTLNETNDHTAAWYEQFFLIHQFGHLGRRYTVNVCASGVTGSASLTTCCN